MILLDTCTLLWLVGSQKHLSPTAKQKLHEHAGHLFLSAISAFEIGVKWTKGLLSLPSKPGVWLDKALKHHGIVEIKIDRAICLTATSLPAIHQDPFDRLIIATAMQNQMLILTPDVTIARYPNVQVIW